METAIVSQSGNETPEDATIWRDMAVPWFVWMVANQGMWFARAATFRDDPYEGFRRVISSDTPVVEGTREVSLQEMFDHMKQNSAEFFKNARDHLYVNSWSLGESESMAMWQIYGSQGNGIAIKSSVGQFKRSAKFDIPSNQYTFGKVEYNENIQKSEASGVVPRPPP